MDGAITPKSQLTTSRKRRLLFLAAVVTAVGSTAALLSWRTSPKRGINPLVFRSPYENSRPGVKYVGDLACVRCHAAIAETYRQHPMGRSLAPVENAPTVKGDPAKDRPHFEAKGLQYSIEHDGGRVHHKETRRDAAGRVVTEISAEASYQIGSGRQAISYLIERDGFLFQSPITWYAKDRRWGLSPGYETRVSSFDRPILADCLFCHANRVERVTSAINRYRTPIFQGHAIGCERCHGPGELHVVSPRVVEGRDVTIVNPADLEPSLRDAVCEQCHLIGPRRVVRAGTRSENFRPGLPFFRFWSVFVADGTGAENRFASQAEQMHISRCFRASQGRLGCISCHDPHVQPTLQEKGDYFRERCLSCHAEKVCALPRNVRVNRRGSDDCVGCHMPRLSSSNNNHVATTNHRILRHERDGPKPREHADSPDRVHQSFEVFHRNLMDDHDRAEAERDRGITLCRLGGERATAEALPLLEAAVAARPNDLPAVECKGEVLGRLGRPEAGLAAYETVLAKDPTRQTALEGAASLSFLAGRHNDAVDYWKRAIAVNPWRSGYFTELARVELKLRDWPAAAEACRQALLLNPSSLQVRTWLVECCIHLGNIEAARSEFAVLLGYDPQDRQELLRRFSSLVMPR
jgi:Tetratricopeptide repeat/Cytochrome c554 and c-prime